MSRSDLAPAIGDRGVDGPVNRNIKSKTFHNLRWSISSRTQLRDNWGNFRQYSLSRPVGLLRLDAHVPAFRRRSDGWLDAVVCDPPYGVRAGGRRSICLSENGSLTETGRRRSEARSLKSFAEAWP